MNKDNFYIQSAVIWTECSPEIVNFAKAHYISTTGDGEVPSEYYFGRNEYGDFVVRHADHWGCVQKCLWFLQKETKEFNYRKKRSVVSLTEVDIPFHEKQITSEHWAIAYFNDFIEIPKPSIDLVTELQEEYPYDSNFRPFNFLDLDLDIPSPKNDELPAVAIINKGDYIQITFEVPDYSDFRKSPNVTDISFVSEDEVEFTFLDFYRVSINPKLDENCDTNFHFLQGRFLYFL